MQVVSHQQEAQITKAYFPKCLETRAAPESSPPDTEVVCLFYRLSITCEFTDKHHKFADNTCINAGLVRVIRNVPDRHFATALISLALPHIADKIKQMF